MRIMTLENAIKKLRTVYENAQKLEFIRNPLAYSLYTVWKMADSSADNIVEKDDDVQIIRCENCKYFYESPCWTNKYCTHADGLNVVTNCSYCSNAERRE
jgi:hypothetical protein